MKTVGNIIMFSVLAIALAACSALAPTPTQTPVPSATSLPTSTFTPEATITSTPTETPTSTSTPIPPTGTPTEPALSMPTGKPAADWEGIPIMPNAIAGDGDSKGYAFTVKATPDEVQKYYEKALKQLGWDLFASGKGNTDAILLMFMKGTDLVSISILPQPEAVLYVLLVK